MYVTLTGIIEIVIGNCAHAESDQHFAQEEQKVSDFVEGNYTQYISHQQIECVASACAEWLAMYGAHDVGVFIQETQKRLQAPEKTLHAAQQAFGQIVIIFLQLLIDIFKTDTDQTAYGDDESAKGQCT